MIKKHKFVFVLVLLTLIFIWGHSCMPPEVSGEESGFVTQLLAKIFGPGVFSEHLVRKLAHFSEYALLAMELGLLFEAHPRIQIMHGFLVAFLDETIQIFSGRGSQVQDVWIDFAGVLTGTMLFFLLYMLVSKRRQKKASQKIEE